VGAWERERRLGRMLFRRVGRAMVLARGVEGELSSLIMMAALLALGGMRR